MDPIRSTWQTEGHRKLVESGLASAIVATPSFRAHKPRMTAALLGIGTELTRGDITNTNGSWLAQELTRLGYEVADIDVVDDDPDRIVAALTRLSSLHELVICTGGLGPTTDDLTTACAARVMGVALELHQPSVEAITRRLAQYGRSLTDSNRKQAFFPKGAQILPNDWGTAPGFVITLNRAKIVFLPGVPSEMMALFEHRVVPGLGLPSERTPHEIVIRTYGLPESTLNDRLAGIAEQCDVVIGYRVRMPEIDVKIHARHARCEVAEVHAERAASAVLERLGPVAYGRGNVSLPGVVGERLKRNHLSLGVAESCTGGLLASLLTSEAGASEWFRGGVVAYSNEVKSNLLGVPADVIAAVGAVSQEVAESMALGVTRALDCSIGVSITGVAGPSGGSEEKPVGTVCFALHGPNGTHSHTKRFVGDRARIQRAAAFYALSMILDEVSSS